MHLYLLSLIGLATSVAAAPTLPGQELTSPGTILNNRTVQVALVATVDLPAVTSYQLLYRTNDASDNPIVTATTIIVPNGAANDRFLAYAVHENSVSMNCAPSYLLQKGSGTGSTGTGHQYTQEQATYAGALAQRWIVSVMDHEGPYSSYGVGATSGRAVLDSIRAVVSFGSTVGLIPTAKSVVWGYSDPYEVLVGVFTGIASALPDFSASFYSIATPKMKALIADTIENQCGGQPAANSVDYFSNEDYFTTGPATVNLPAWEAMYVATDLSADKARTPTVPVHIYHALNDEAIPYSIALTLTKNWCANGASVELVTNTVPQAEHAVEEEYGIAGALSFFADRFNGVPFAKACAYKSDPAGIQIPTITNTSLTNNIH
ncbi:hypothetical protein RQP46_001633 [Phenoliferia psychrophenolica]